MRRIQLVFFIFVFCVSLYSLVHPYIGNTWGKYYYLKETSDVYLNKYEEVSVYRMNSVKLLYCSEKEENDRLFCWHFFIGNETPIGGWIESESLFALEK